MTRGKGKTYPSDHRRYFKVKEDILDDPKLTDCSADVFRFYIRLLAMLNRTKAKDGEISLGRSALNLLSGREQRRHALRVARAGALAGLYTMSTQGLQTLIRVRKWPELQEIAPTPPRPDPDIAPTTSTKPNPSSLRASPPATGLRPAASPPLDPYRLPPGTPKLTDKRIATLIAIKPNGVVYSPGDVAIWYAFVRPKMVAREIKRFSAAAGKWWARLRPGDVKEAREWTQRCNVLESKTKLLIAEAAREPELEFTEDQIQSALSAGLVHKGEPN